MKYALVIDDNRQQADTLVSILSLLDVMASPVYGSNTAMQAIKGEKWGVIFLDINMPGVDGFEVMAYLQREPGGENTPVVIVSSDDQTLTIRRAMKEGAFHYLVKPVTVAEVERVLRKARIIK